MNCVACVAVKNIVTNTHSLLEYCLQSLSLYQTPLIQPLENEEMYWYTKKCQSQRLLLVAKMIPKLRKFYKILRHATFSQLFLLLTFLVLASWRGCVKTPVDQRELLVETKTGEEGN